MFCFSIKITHPKVFIFRNWESFGNICIRSQSLLLAKAGEVVWVATFELQLNRDFKQRQNRPMQHHKSRWSIPSVVLQSFFSENLSSHLKKKIPRESRSIPVTLSKVAFFEAFPLCVCGHIEIFGTHWLFLQLSITCDVNFTYNPNVKPLKACRTCKKNLITLTNLVSRLYLFSKLSRAPIWWNDAEVHKFQVKTSILYDQF